MKDTVSNRRDLVFVGARLLGIYFAVSSFISGATWFDVHMSMNPTGSWSDLFGWSGLVWGVLPWLFGVIAGVVLALYAGSIEAWFAARDRARL
ncbi:MAG: hypothetical protein NXI31_26455 [bacterium]|nr:hypothetical protein [bacterium]